MKNVFAIFQISVHEDKDNSVADAQRPLIAATKHE